MYKMPALLPQQSRQSAPPKRSRLPWFFLLLIVMLGVVYWFFIVSPTFAVRSIELVGSDNNSIKAISDHLIGRNMFLLNKESVEQEIKQIYPPVARVSLIRGLPHTVRLVVTLRAPKLRWQTGSAVFILDEDGQSFEEGEKDMYNILPKVVDYSGIPIAIGDTVVSANYIQFIEDLQEKIPDLFHRSVLSYEVHETTYHIDIVLDGDLRVRLTSQRPAKEQLDSAEAILLAHPSSHQIDVRVPIIGYYK